ncbi:hypothetical protein BN1723_016904, partial [Verticillium longisporum]
MQLQEETAGVAQNLALIVATPQGCGGGFAVEAYGLCRLTVVDPELANESWDRFLPDFGKKTLSHRRVPHKVSDKSKKVYTPFPPAPEKSKVDKQIESGEYFLGKEAKARAVAQERVESQKQKKEEKLQKREREYVAPEEGEKKKKRKKSEA